MYDTPLYNPQDFLFSAGAYCKLILDGTESLNMKVKEACVSYLLK